MLNYKYFKKIYFALIVLLLILITGTIGFRLIEGYSFINALYMTVITVSTVGFREIKELSDIGKIFTIFLIITSFGTFAYTITSISIYILDGEFNRYFRNLRTNRKVNKINNHTIVCGYGRNGKQAVAELKAHNKEYVVIEQKPEIVEQLRESHIPYIEGDATVEKTLEKAGIERAKALISTLPNDAANLFVVLTAREMSSSLLIISRASQDNSDKKLRRAGANNVIMPDKIGGAHMASLVIKPDVIEFIDYVMGQGTSSVNLEEITYENLPDEYKDKTIEELGIKNKSGANIVGYRKPEGGYLINPSPDVKVVPKSKIFVLGTTDQIASFRSKPEQEKILKKGS